jgi:hypothetical protein
VIVIKPEGMALRCSAWSRWTEYSSSGGGIAGLSTAIALLRAGFEPIERCTT